MVNQWGRDGNFPSSGGRSSGAGGVIVAAIVALLLGAGGGYTTARVFTGASASDIQIRDDRISDLERQISDLKFRSDGRSDAEAELRDRIEELTKANATLKALADENARKGDARAEIDALKKTIEEAGDLRTELGRAKRSLQVSELQIIELEDTIKSQRGEIDKLRRGLSDAATRDDAGAKALAAEIKALEAALADSRKQAQAAGDLRKRLAVLEDDLAKRTADVRAARDELKAAQDDVAKARAEAERLKKALETALAQNTDKSGQGDALRRELDIARKALAAREAEFRDLQTRFEASLEERKAALARAEELADEVARLKKTMDALHKASVDQPKADAPDLGEPLVVRRDADLVRAAIEDMPGYARLTPDQQSELAARLEAGDCVADTLKAVLGRVPTVALRNLIRDLGSKC